MTLGISIKCHYADSHFFIMLNVIMLSVIMVNVVVPTRWHLFLNLNLLKNTILIKKFQECFQTLSLFSSKYFFLVSTFQHKFEEACFKLKLFDLCYGLKS
jgi:hypothetical protein